MAKKEDIKKEDIKQDENIEEEEIVEDINVPSEDDKILKLEEENARLKNEFARAYADCENLKRRLNQEAEQTRKYRIQSFAIEILPVLDNLERALNAKNDENDSFYKGVSMIYDQLKNALKNEGVVEIDCLNKPFDANFHQAIMTEKKDGVESGIVIEVLQKGYLLKDRILRASMVKVSE